MKNHNSTKLNTPLKTTEETPVSDISGSQLNFYGLGIAPNLLDLLDKMKFLVPTPIQYKAIPIAIGGKDIMGIAQTGTGKTLAFAIPMIQRLYQIKGRGLIIVPTRELALQVDETYQKFKGTSGSATAVLIGGASMYNQIRMIRNNPRVIIATPGRLIDHLEQRNVRLDDVRILVLDEADRMLDMGFAPQIARVLSRVPSDRQTMLFSATMPREIMELASSYMKLPVSVEIAKSGTTADRVKQELFIVRNEHKKLLLEKLLQQYHGSVLLFSRTKHNASKITRMIKSLGHSVAEIHSNRSFSQRREALSGFKSGRFRILVATDIAARGIDVTGIELVINYDLPDEANNYVHRIGRTGRAGHEGHAISFAMPDQGNDVKNIEKLIRAVLPISKHPEVLSGEFYRSAPAASSTSRNKGFLFRSKRRSFGGRFRRR
ncbi:MAG: DEAD/DEAH box helicase [bacterium]|nr:DEAD/DEAH box helicase [bacterium]